MKWTQIKDFPSYYVSDDGQVRTTLLRKRILKPAVDRGYLKVKLYKDGKNHTKKVHRLVAEAFIPKPDGMTEVNHIDADKSNNHYTNLEWTNRLGNMRHCDKLRLREFRSGEDHGMAKLSMQDVLTIRNLYASGQTSYPKLSRQYGISISSAQRIVTRQSWKYV